MFAAPVSSRLHAEDMNSSSGWKCWGARAWHAEAAFICELQGEDGGTGVKGSDIHGLYLLAQEVPH